MVYLFKFFSYWPLWLLHGLGWCAGWLAYGFSGSYRRRLLAHAALAGLTPALRRQAVGAAGQMVAELPRLWLGAPVPVRWEGAECVEAALARGRGAVFLTPHLGCFEITAQAYAARFGTQGWPMTVLFRPPRKAALVDLVAAARQRPGLQTAPTTLAGVKKLLQALRRGACVGLLPDQVPPRGQGVWAPFFGQSAYTMTLATRLAVQSQATVLMAWGERLSWGRGYVVHVTDCDTVWSTDPVQAATQLNLAMQALIARAPGQYLWGYGRFKEPRALEDV